MAQKNHSRPKEYDQATIQKILSALPATVKSALFSMETSDHLWAIADKHDVKDFSIFAFCISRVLIGLLPPGQLAPTLQKKLGIAGDSAEQISHEVKRLVYIPIRKELEEMYGAELFPTAGKMPEAEKKVLEEIQPPTEASGEDTYREPVEE